MSIVTGRGDEGETDLMFGRRIGKSDIRVETYGTLDELNAALGLVRANLRGGSVATTITEIQKDLILLMGELATVPEDLGKYEEKGFRIVDETMVGALSTLAKDLEKDGKIQFKGWVLPGSSEELVSAHLDLARSVCRRAERRVHSLMGAGGTENMWIMRYLNRLSDVCWLLARGVEDVEM